MNSPKIIKVSAGANVTPKQQQTEFQSRVINDNKDATRVEFKNEKAYVFTGASPSRPSIFTMGHA